MEVLDILNKLEIEYTMIEHEPVFYLRTGTVRQNAY